MADWKNSTKRKNAQAKALARAQNTGRQTNLTAQQALRSTQTANALAETNQWNRALLLAGTYKQPFASRQRKQNMTPSAQIHPTLPPQRPPKQSKTTRNQQALPLTSTITTQPKNTSAALTLTKKIPSQNKANAQTTTKTPAMAEHQPKKQRSLMHATIQTVNTRPLLTGWMQHAEKSRTGNANKSISPQHNTTQPLTKPNTIGSRPKTRRTQAPQIIIGSKKAGQPSTSSLHRATQIQTYTPVLQALPQIVKQKPQSARLTLNATTASRAQQHLLTNQNIKANATSSTARQQASTTQNNIAFQQTAQQPQNYQRMTAASPNRQLPMHRAAQPQKAATHQTTPASSIPSNKTPGFAMPGKHTGKATLPRMLALENQQAMTPPKEKNWRPDRRLTEQWRAPTPSTRQPAAPHAITINMNPAITTTNWEEMADELGRRMVAEIENTASGAFAY